MIVALLLLSQISAVGHIDMMGRLDSIMVRNGAQTVAVKATNDWGGGMGLRQSVKLGKVGLTGANSRITGSNAAGSIDATEISKKLYPNVPQKYDVGMTLRSKGGIQIGGVALWVFAWDAVETMSEPSAEKFAVEVGLSHTGKLIVSRSAPLTGLGDHLFATGTIQFGEEVALVAEGISLFNLRLWKEDKGCPGSGCISKNGNLYWDDNGPMFVYDPSQSRFILKGAPAMGYLVGAISVGSDDVIVFERGLWTTKNATYQFPGYSYAPTQFFVIPNIGLGFSVFLPKKYPGMIVSANTLTPIAMIQRGRQR